MPDTNIPVTCPHCDAAFTAPADVAVKEARERDEAEIEGLALKMKMDEATRHAAYMQEPAQRGDIEQLHQELRKIRENTAGIPTIKGIMIFFVVVFLIGCCVAFVGGTGGF